MGAAVKIRKSDHDVDSIFPARWSPRAMSAESITDKELMRLLEAARWAPSAFNSQPWRFLYAKRDTPLWEKFFNLLAESNQVWCKNAAVLMVIVSQAISDYNQKPLPTHAFDTGAAWENLAMQGSMRGLVVHGMAGFDYDKTKQELDIPDDYQIQAMCAIGKPGNKEDLPEQLQEREIPSDRKPLKEIAGEGKFRW